MKPKTIAKVTWFITAIVIIAVLGTLDDVVRHAAILVPVAVAAVVMAYVLGRRHGRGRVSKAATQRLEDSQRARQVTELEAAAGRPIDAITASYRHVQRQYGDLA